MVDRNPEPRAAGGEDPPLDFYLSLPYLQSLLTRLDTEIAQAKTDGTPARLLSELRDGRDMVVNMLARARLGLAVRP